MHGMAAQMSPAAAREGDGRTDGCDDELRVQTWPVGLRKALDREGSEPETDVGTGSDAEAQSSCSEAEVGTAADSARPPVPRVGRALPELSEADRAGRQIKAILNKLTRERFEPLYGQLLVCCGAAGAGDETVKAVAFEVFSKATTQPTLVELYADLCSRLHGDLQKSGHEDAFKRALLGECQRSFHEHLEPPPVHEGLDYEDRYRELVKQKTRMLGNVRLIGCLLRRKMLSPKVAFICIDALFAAGTPETLETLCAFLRTIGSAFDVPNWACHQRFEEAFTKVEELIRNPQQCPRMRCLMQDLLDFRGGGWQEVDVARAELARRPMPEPATAAAPAASADAQRFAGSRQAKECWRRPSAEEAEQRGSALRPTAGRPAACRQAGQAVAEEPPARKREGEAKCLCRFLVGVEETKQFQVCRRLIGPGGQHMKRILKEAPDAKIRVRGIGSKYLEGPEKVESSEPLMVCVSATSRASFERAASMVEALLEATHKEYRTFCQRQGLPVPNLAVVREAQRLH